MVLRLRRRARRAGRDRGAVAVVTALLMTVFLALSAFTIDVGYWYAVGLQEQRAADAAALAGVTRLPGDPTGAFTTAQSFASQNGFTDGASAVSVQPAMGSQPSRLKVTVTKTVPNVFGRIMGRPTTTISRSAVADYVGPVPMGSPCNEFGNDPAAGSNRSTKCDNTGQFWANVGTMSSTKVSGDAYQDGKCTGTVDGCTGATNDNYDPDGYFYSVTLSQPMRNLTVEAFDPAFVAVGDTCTLNGLTDLTGIYQPGPLSPYCTGDQPFNNPSGSNVGTVTTQFIVRKAVPASNPWDPNSYPVVGGCTKTFPGYNESLAGISSPTFANVALKSVFRQWVNLCTIGNAPAGTYFVQVKTNGLGTDLAQGHNRFALRAYSTTSASGKDAISLAGFQKMGIYANLPGAMTTFHLARIPSSAAGHVLNVSLFDIGDSSGVGTVSITAPGTTLSGCVGTGPISGLLPGCSLVASSLFNGKWQTIAVPVPSTYSCDDLDPTACWFKLGYNYGLGNQPSDTTSWTASLEGDPVRLVQ